MIFNNYMKDFHIHSTKYMNKLSCNMCILLEANLLPLCFIWTKIKVSWLLLRYYHVHHLLLDKSLKLRIIVVFTDMVERGKAIFYNEITLPSFTIPGKKVTVLKLLFPNYRNCLVLSAYGFSCYRSSNNNGLYLLVDRIWVQCWKSLGLYQGCFRAAVECTV